MVNESDRKLFYYLERETRKLEEIAWSDTVLERVAERADGVSVRELRNEKLRLSQPGEGGWHFWADDKNPERAEELAATWAESFVKETNLTLQNTETINPYTQIALTQKNNLPVTRKIA